MGTNEKNKTPITRRAFIRSMLVVGYSVVLGPPLYRRWKTSRIRETACILKASDYQTEISGRIIEGLAEIGFSRPAIQGKRILLKPNLVEVLAGSPQINTDPAVILGAAQAFRSLGAAEVVVAEGPGHCRDTFQILEESGLYPLLKEERISFVDINFDDVYAVANSGRKTDLKSMYFPATLQRMDLIVSLAK
jgi:uncharacterized protein (DUF362 family)